MDDRAHLTRLLFWVMVGVVGTLNAAEAATLVGKDIAVNIDPRPNGLNNDSTRHGYFEYRVRLTNNSKTDEHPVTLALPANASRYGNDNIQQITRKVTVAPETTAVVSLLQPPVPIEGYNLLVIANKDRKEINLDVVTHPSNNYGSGNPRVLVLTSKSVDANFGDFAGRYARHNTLKVVRADVGVTDYSTNWLGYTCYDGLVLIDRDIRTMPAAAKQAVRRYVECGGSLTVLGAWQPDDSWHAQRFDWKPNTRRNSKHYFVGFGEVSVVPQQKADAISSADYQMMADDWRRSSLPWREHYDINDANGRFPVIDDLGVPVRGLLLLIITFAVLIGPVNLWVLGRTRKRMWLLWTVPAISLLFSGAVWVYASFSEGWGANERTEGITLLDERKLTATTLGITAYYSTLTPGSGFQFGPETELTPALASFDHYYGRGSDGRSRSMEWTDGQHLRSGWIVARVPAHFKVRKSDPTQRARIDPVAKADGTVEAVNGLGADVTKLVLATPDGKIYTAGPTPAGQPFNLAPAEVQRTLASADTLRRLYQNALASNAANDLAIKPSRFLQPGTYIAVMDDNPFIESGLGKEDSRRSRAVVYGVADMQPKQ